MLIDCKTIHPEPFDLLRLIRGLGLQIIQWKSRIDVSCVGIYIMLSQ